MLADSTISLLSQPSSASHAPPLGAAADNVARGAQSGGRAAHEEPDSHAPAHEQRLNEVKNLADIRQARNTLVLVLTVSLLFMVGEFVGGSISGSLAIIADAAHLLVDVFGFALSLFFLWLAQGKPAPNLSYGYKRAEVLGAVLSVSLIWLVAGAILYEAVVRFQLIISLSPSYRPVEGWLMFTMACIGVLCNFIILVVIGHEPHGGAHGHSHGGGVALHDEQDADDHHAPDPVLIGGPILNGVLEIIDTPMGERVRFSAHHALVGQGAMTVEIEREGGRVELLHLEPQPGVDRSFLSLEVPGEPHEFKARVLWAGAEQQPLDVVAFAMKEPGGHGHGHAHGAQGHGEHATEIHKRNINVSTAFVHALGHMAQDIGVVVAGALIWAYPFDVIPMMQLADPIATFLFTLIGLIPTWGLLRTSVRLLMEGVPHGVDALGIANKLAHLDGVVEVHDLHIWGMTVDRVYLSVHLTLGKDALIADVLDRAHLLLQKNNVHHSTIQTEVAKTVKHHGHGGIRCHSYSVPSRAVVPQGVEMV
jgi:zinc transporter 2